MTKAQRRANKKGNQERKQAILSHVDRRGKRSGSWYLGGVCQTEK